jgi:hypothetical protein
MDELTLRALPGTNPLGFLAALGVLDALHEDNPDATLRWTRELVPRPIITGVADLEHLIEVLDRDRQRWVRSAVLTFPLADAKPDERGLREWFDHVLKHGDHYADGDLLCALVAEGAFDGNMKAKPTHLHFTAGQQRFLDSVRELAKSVDPERLEEALQGPWRYDSKLPSLSWDARGERIYAIRATNPSNDTKLGVPGADWLAFRGLSFYPTMRSASGALRTTASDLAWKRGAFRWPLWDVACTRPVVRSLVADRGLVGSGRVVSADTLHARGISLLLEAKIRRNDQGGYGSFGAAEILVDATETVVQEMSRQI